MNSNTESNCAGKPIKASMEMFSADLIAGCRKFAILANETIGVNQALHFNTACIFLATSAIEAEINELISVAQACYKEEPKSFCHALSPSLIKKLSMTEKWNLIAANENGSLWNGTIEPFQSFDLINSLRNELVHYKGKMLPKGEAPNRKIKGLLDRFGIEDNSLFKEDDCSGWVRALLNNKKLGLWVADRIEDFSSQILVLIGSGT
jgi:hypothetical protein